MKPPNSIPPSREESAKIEIGHTTVSRRLAIVITLLFAAIITTVPVMQQVADLDGFLDGERNSAWPQSLDIVRSLGEFPAGEKDVGLIRTVLRRNAFILEQIKTYETRLENQSMLTKKILGPSQELLSRYSGVGNEKAYLGRDQWLYYRPDVDYVIGPAFLNERVIRRRALSGNTLSTVVHPDPVPAILDFHKQLAQRGVELVLVPVPAKPGIVSEPLSGKPQQQPLQNPSFENFKDQMAAHGVALFDPAPILAGKVGASEASSYLITDTHWTPDGMDAVAEELAEFLKNRYFDQNADAVVFERAPKVWSNDGDIATMLKLPEDSTLFPRETVTLQQVQPVDGVDSGETEQSEILLLGDSFVNIYSAKELGWGERAGLAEQLEFYLQRPVDRLARNDNASYATREMLRDAVAQGQQPLESKKVVIWEFAVRELASGNWKVLDILTPEAENKDETDMFLPDAGSEMIVDATVGAISEIPIPGSVPYRDHVCMVHLTDIQGQYESVVFMQSMRDAELTGVANWQVGSKVTVRLQRWNDVFAQYGSMNQSELDRFSLLDAYGWAEPLGESPAKPAVPAGLMVYAGGLFLLVVLVCRKAKDGLLRTGIGVIGLSWILLSGSVLLIGERVKDQVPEEVVVPEIKEEPVPSVEISDLSFQEFCAATAAQAEKNGQLVIRGVDDWLFLRSELRHLGIEKFWGEYAAEVSQASNPDYADPLAGILNFDAQLKEAGVDLWIVPVPPKAAIYPDKLAGARFAAGSRLNTGYQEFYDLLKKEGVEVVDITQKFLEERSDGNDALYCKQDSHWAGPGMDLLTDELVKRLRTQIWYEQLEKKTFRAAYYEQDINGDLRKMLGDNQFPKERIQLNKVKSEATGQPVQTDSASPILVLGDSHTLVFHGGGDMHAVGAGLVDLLALKSGVVCDLIGVKGSGAGPSRRTLYGESRKNPEYLSGKKLIIWCFTAREFTESTGMAWRKIPVK